MRPGVAREQQAAGGVAVEAVDRRGRPPEAEAQRVQMVLEAVAGRGSGMDGEARGLVDHDRLAVDEKHPILKRVHGDCLCR
jgi:hypothetical protein